MEFRDLKKQYEVLKDKIDLRVLDVMKNAHYIGGKEVTELSDMLKEYVGAKYCLTCANGTDALMLVLKAWGIKSGDVVFVPDFTFFSSAEVIALLGATPYFVDVDEKTFNLDPEKLEEAINIVKAEGKYNLGAVIAVDLFGLPADYEKIQRICSKHGLKLLEDGAQGFSGKIGDRLACSFGDASTTSFFPAKPLGCYGDGGAIFTNDEEVYKLMKSYAVHGKGDDKYDNVRIGYNSRLDTVQAAILIEKFKALKEYEFSDINKIAKRYTEMLKGVVETPEIPEGFTSAWAQYTIKLNSKEERDNLQKALKEMGIPTMIYYPKSMHMQSAFKDVDFMEEKLKTSTRLCDISLSLPISPYLTEEDQNKVVDGIKLCLNKGEKK